MGCHGLHCDGCRHGGGPAGAAVVLLVFIAVAVRAEWHAIAAAAEVIAWCLLGSAAAAGAVTAAMLTGRVIRRGHRDRAGQRPATVLLPPGRYHVIPPGDHARRAAIEAPRPRLHVVPGGRQQARSTGRRGRR